MGTGNVPVAEQAGHVRDLGVDPARRRPRHPPATLEARGGHAEVVLVRQEPVGRLGEAALGGPAPRPALSGEMRCVGAQRRRRSIRLAAPNPEAASTNTVPTRARSRPGTGSEVLGRTAPRGVGFTVAAGVGVGLPGRT